MSAIAILPAENDELPNAVFCAALEFCPEPLAIISEGRVRYVNQAFARTFGLEHDWEIRAGASASPQLASPWKINGQAEAAAAPNRPPTRPEADARGTSQVPACDRELHNSTRPPVLLDTKRTTFHVEGREWQVLSAPAAKAILADAPRPDASSMEAIGRLVSGVAHDFNNLLTGFLLYCDLLRAGLRETPRLLGHVEEMRAAAQRGALLVGQLLDVARQEPAPPDLLSWNDAVRSLADFLRRLIGEHIVLATDLAAGLAPVRMDPAQMQQVILNLVLNARDAMPGGGRITVTTCNVAESHGHSLKQEEPSTAKPIPMVELAVSDTGDGMDEGTLSKAFTPFFTTKPPGRGTGLGLATVRAIVLKANGTAHLESTPGKGTRVAVRLPCEASTGLDLHPPDSSPGASLNFRGNSL